MEGVFLILSIVACAEPGDRTSNDAGRAEARAGGHADEPEHVSLGSPEQTIASYLWATFTGRPEHIPEIVASSEEPESTKVKAQRTLAELYRQALLFRKEARSTFGDRETETIAEVADILRKIPEGIDSYKGAREYVAESVQVYLNRSGDKAIAMVPAFSEEYVPLVRENDTWYVSSAGADAEETKTLLDFFDRVIQRLRESRELLAQSDSIEDFQRRVQKGRGADKRVTTKELGLLALQAWLRVELIGGPTHSLKEKELGIKLTLSSEIDEEQTVRKDDIRLYLLTQDGIEVKDALFGPPRFGTVTLKQRPTTIVREVELDAEQLKAGERYYLVCTLRNLAGMAIFTAVE